MAVIPETVVSPVGGISGARAAAAGDTLVPNENVDLIVTNGSGASMTVTITAKTPCNQGVLHDNVVTVAAGQTKAIGPMSPGRYADPITGLATVTYSATASVTVYALRS